MATVSAKSAAPPESSQDGYAKKVPHPLQVGFTYETNPYNRPQCP